MIIAHGSVLGKLHPRLPTTSTPHNNSFSYPHTDEVQFFGGEMFGDEVVHDGCGCGYYIRGWGFEFSEGKIVVTCGDEVPVDETSRYLST